jgi:transposase
MLYSDCIEKLLQLEDVIVTNIDCIENEMHIELRMEKRFHHCPRCNTLTSKVHDYRTQLVKDVSIAGYNTILHLHKRRHVCPVCGKRFDEEIGFLPKYHRFTNRVFMQIYKQFKECRSIKGIAKDNNMSPPTAAKVIDLIDHTAFELPEVLAIDEFRGNAEGEKFQCILTDPKNHKIIEILPTRKHEDIYDYLSNFDSLEKVKYVVMDMTGGYKALMKRLFPEATLIVDKYHYVRQIGYALERTRVEEQKRLSDKWRKYFKRSKYLLLKNPKALDMDDYTQLQNLFRISPKLKEAYDIKLEFEDVIASKDRKDAAWRLSKWILKVQNSNLEEFKKVAATYQRWGKEILNSFDHPYTNGFTEGCNNRIKVLKRVSFGMPRFKRFRRRILHIMLD